MFQTQKSWICNFQSGTEWALAPEIALIQLQMEFEIWVYGLALTLLTMCCISSDGFLTGSKILPKCVLFCSLRSEMSFIPLIQHIQRLEDIFLFDSRAWIPMGRDITPEQGEFGYVALMQTDN